MIERITFAMISPLDFLRHEISALGRHARQFRQFQGRQRSLPADFLGKSETQGTIEAGKNADLLLLDSDPLEDIRNTRRIRAVILGGRLLDRSTLDKFLSSVQTFAASH